MKSITLLSLLITAISCGEKKDKFNYETSIVSITYKAQLKYLDNTLLNYAKISDTGNYYYRLSAELDDEAEIIKDKIRSGGLILKSEQDAFLNKFGQMFGDYPNIDIEAFKELHKIPIKTVSDVDVLKLFIKNNFIAILLNNKLLPYDTWGIMACNKEEIKDGEELKVDLGTIAYKSYHQNKWFLIKNGVGYSDQLKKENIVDTLIPNEEGMVQYKTKSYKKGKNNLTFVSLLNNPQQNRWTYRVVTFYVK